MARCKTCHRRIVNGRGCPVHGEPSGARMRGGTAPPPVAPPWSRPLGALVGTGGFAAVWAIEGGGVLKVAHAAHDLARRRLAREAEVLAAIGAPATPRLDGHGVLADGRAWVAMERVVGRGLTELTLDGALRADRAVRLTIAIVESLARVHAAGFVHRDLKPDNLILRDDGTVAILDLGIARRVPDDPDDPTRANVQVGSLEYIAPEQLIDAAAVDARSDLYAIGCILYELCAGRPPFVGDAAALERAHAALRAPRLGAMASVPIGLEAIAMDCLAKDPGKRPPDASDLLARLHATRDTPSVVRTMAVISQVAEAKQPVVLVWAELARVDRAVIAMLGARHVMVVSQRGRRVLGALLGSAHTDPAGVALALARELDAAGAKVALHLDALFVEGTTLHGDAVTRPESWLPAEGWSGVLLTRALAAVVQAPTRPADAAGPGFRLLGDVADAAELFGREALLTDLVVDAAVALRGTAPAEFRSGSGTWHPTGPAFALLVGDAGTGKTVVAAELARRIAELRADVYLARVPAPGSGQPSPLAALIGDPDGPTVRAVGDAIRAAARGRPTAVILDDLQHADHELLDALEYATLGGEPLPLWILGIASPRLALRRPGLGAGAERYRRDELGALDEDAAVELASALLRPAEYPPVRAVRKLVALARRNPMHLTMLVREIHERGAVRQRPSGEYFLDTTTLNELEPIALGPWIAARETSALPAELVELARLCAVVGGPFGCDEVTSVVDELERAGGLTAIDPDVGVRELVVVGVLVAGPRGHAFRQPLVEEGLYATTPDDRRRAIHAAALSYWTRPGAGERDVAAHVAARVARHAEGVDEPGAAANAYATLGEIAEREHRTFDAEHAWSGALRHLESRGTRRAKALLGRARAYTRMQRLHDALGALTEATEIAAELDDAALEVSLLVEQAIVLDFCEQFDQARAAIARAGARFAEVDSEGLAIDLELARGREQFRAQRFAEAATTLRDVLARGQAAGRVETATIAALLLGPALADLGELDEASRVFEELIAACTRRGDRFHLAAAYGNRAWLWSAYGAIDRTTDDLRVASQLARESGQAVVERSVTHNLAEQLLWTGDLDEALRLARRGLALQLRAGEGSTGLDRVLLARVLAARGDLDELGEVLDTFVTDEPLAADDATGLKTLEILRGLLGTGSTVWPDVLVGTEALYTQLRLELWHLVATRGMLDEDRAAIARDLAAGDPIWSRRATRFAP